MTLEEAQKINAAVQAGCHVFKYDRPMDPRSAMELLAQMIDEETDFVDITEGGGPNEHMQAVMMLEAVAGRMERAIFGLRLIHAAAKEIDHANSPALAELGKSLATTARHALTALGERP